MRKLNLSKIVRAQIRKELQKQDIVRESIKASVASPAQTSRDVTGNTLMDKMDKQILAVFEWLLVKRIITGGLPAKLSAETGLKVYIPAITTIFDLDDDIIKVAPQEVTLTTFAEDRWVYIYLNEDTSYTVNKYNPTTGANTDRIPICKVWVESSAVTYDAGTIRDLRPVGIASSNLNHVLRQLFLHIMHGVPAALVDSVTVTPLVQSGGLFVNVDSNDDKVFYASINPIPDTEVEIPLPGSGETIDYYVVMSAQVSNDDPDDLQLNMKAIDITEGLNIYEIPVAIVKGVTITTTEITADMISTIGYQRTAHDNYCDIYDYKQAGTINNGDTIDIGQPVAYQGRINRVLAMLGTFDAIDSGGLASGDSAEVALAIKKNGVTINTTTINYSDSESNVIQDEVVNLAVLPQDVLTVEATLTLESGYSFTIEDLSVKLFLSKIYY